ncbi:hypothetical protein [Streptomyces sp. NPDC048411]|uniref:hypothetical protein n=1 Tax=Streptomyces sp. NPDC048411 TaxID=3157206 RepID=UPI0034517574
MSVYDTTGTPHVPGNFPSSPSRRPRPGFLPELPPMQTPTVIIIVLFTVAVAAGQYELATALGTLLAAPQFAPQKV